MLNSRNTKSQWIENSERKTCEKTGRQNFKSPSTYQNSTAIFIERNTFMRLKKEMRRGNTGYFYLHWVIWKLIWLHKSMLEAEFWDMGISLESQNIVNEYTENAEGIKVVKRRRKLVRREMVLVVPNDLKRIYESLKGIVERTDISHLVAQNQRLKVKRTKRAFQVNDQKISTHANFDGYK